MQEGGAPQRTTVGKRDSPLGGIENELDGAIADSIDDVRAPFRHLVDLFGLDPPIDQKALCTAGCDDLKAEVGQDLGCRQDAWLVGIAHRDEYGPAARQARTAANLAFGKGDREGS